VVDVLIPITKKISFLKKEIKSMTISNYNLPRVNSHNQISSPKKEFSVHVLEAGLMLLMIGGSLVLAVLDPSIRPLFLGLTTKVVVAYLQK
jgi:hypothetical protein